MSGPTGAASGAAARLVMSAIGAYQALTAGRPPTCRFDPSCSSYAHEAVQELGVLRGGAAALRRLSRCHPWGGAGYDPVPLPRAQARPPERGLTRA